MSWIKWHYKGSVILCQKGNTLLCYWLSLVGRYFILSISYWKFFSLFLCPGCLCLFSLVEAMANSLKVVMKGILNHLSFFCLPGKMSLTFFFFFSAVREGCCVDLWAESGKSMLKKWTCKTLAKQSSKNHLAIGGATTGWYLRSLASGRSSILFLGIIWD